jgi:alpha-L-fucosidase 2
MSVSFRIVGLIIGLATLSWSTSFAGDPSTTVWFEQPAESFDESLVLGNGRLGVMVFGGIQEEKIILNEESVWSGSRVENNVSPDRNALPEMRRLLAEGKFAEANTLKKKAFPVSGSPQYAKRISPFGRYQTLGALHLRFPGAGEKVSGYRRTLDLRTASGKVCYQQQGQTVTRDYFVSAPDNVFVARLSGPVTCTIRMDRPERFETKAVGDRELLMTGTLDDGFGNAGLTYAARVKVLHSGGQVVADGESLVVTDAENVVLLFAAATDYQGFAGRRCLDPISATATDLNEASGDSFASLRERHEEDHQKFFSRVQLSLPETTSSSLATDRRLANYREGKSDPSLVALFADMGRYLLISSSRPGGLPANLQGIWAEEVHTMWNGDYHFNINTQMNYWPALSCNLVEMQEPLQTFIASLVDPGSTTARIYYDSPGWIAHRLTNIWGYTAPAGLDIGGPAWLCEHLWEQYAYTLDRGYLACVYPIMKSSVEFYLANLYEEPAHGWLVTGPSASPENGFILPDGKTGSGICMGPTIDMQQLRELFGNTVRAAQILNCDESLQVKLRKTRSRLAPNQIAPNGILQEWLEPYKEREPTHRHCSPLYGLYPYYEISGTVTPEIALAARKLLERRGVGQSTGWSNAWKINLWARLGDAELAWGFVRQMLIDNTFDNLLSRFRPSGKKLFQIEANLGATAGVTEMLLQSQPESGAIEAAPVIRLLPALPEAWHSGMVTGLLARGAVEVDLSWANGELKGCRLRPRHAGELKVRYRGRELAFKGVAGVEKVLLPQEFVSP